ncbi:MAG: tail fiber domain-containing protein, partial [Balneolaceae bacterium]
KMFWKSREEHEEHLAYLRGYWGYINGDNNNVGMDLTVEGGTSNTGLIVNADVAADFNGTVEIDGNTTSTGSIRSVGTNDATFTSASDFNSLPEVSMNSQNDANAEFIARVENNGSVDFATLSIADENLSNQVFISGENGSVTATTLNQTSDSRLKTNVTTLSNALVNTLEMRGVSYNWIDENKSQNTQIGVIAQEVEEIYPEFVHTNDEGMKSVNYSQMVAVLIEAVKELNNKIEVLEEENTELQAQVNDIETMRAQLNQLMTLINIESNVESFSADK